MYRKLIQSMAATLVTVMTLSSFSTNLALALETTETDESNNEQQIETTVETVESTVPEYSESEVEVTYETTEIVETQETEIPETTLGDPGEEGITEPSDGVPKETETTVETTLETTVETTVETTPELEAFNQSVTVDNTIITVTADAGVFPAGAYLDATAVESEAVNQTDNVVATKTFDICVYDVKGNEIEPDLTYGTVKVSFSDALFSDKNLDASVYHIEEDQKIVELNYDVVDGNAVATTDGFSLYTVEFTYEDLSYTLNGNDSVSLATILKAVGLTGEVTKVEISNGDLIKYENGNIYALKAFTSKEWMKVSINGITYIIDVTDDPGDEGVATVEYDAYAVLYDSGKLVFQQGDAEIAAYGTKVQAWALQKAYDDPDTTSVKELPAWSAYASDITEIVFNDKVEGSVNVDNLFASLSNVTTITNIEKLDMSTVVSAVYMFKDCSSLTALDLSSFDMSACMSANSMFAGCEGLETVILDGWSFNSGLTSLGSFMSGMFSGCSSLASISTKNWDNLPAECSSIWGRYASATSSQYVLDVTGWDCSTITSMNGLFAGAPVTSIIGLNSWNTATVTNMEQMFSGCSNLTSFDYQSFNTSNVTSISQMFQGVPMETLDLSNWNTSSLTCMGYGSLTEAETIILDGLDLSHLTRFGGDFCGKNKYLSLKGAKINNNFVGNLGRAMCGTSLETVDVTDLDISECTSLYAFFANMNVLKTVTGLETWDTSSITNYSQLFFYCSDLKTVDLSAFTFHSGDTINQMFTGAYAMETVVLPASFSNVTVSDSNNLDLFGEWKKNGSEELIDGSAVSLGGTYVRSLRNEVAYADYDAIAVLYSDGTLVFQKGTDFDSSKTVVIYWNVSSTSTQWAGDDYKNSINTVVFRDALYGRTSASYMFSGCSNLTAIVNLDKFGTSKVTSLRSMFNDCTSLASVDLEGWNTSKVRDFDFMFNNCTSLTEVKNADNLVTSAATSSQCMFQVCTNLETIEGTDTWDLSNVTNTGWMFYRNEKLNGIDTSNWGMGSAKRMNLMFYNCFAIEEINVSNWDVSSLETIIDSSNNSNVPLNYTFAGCHNVEELDFSNWRVSDVVKNYYGMCLDCYKVTELDFSGFNFTSDATMTSMVSGCSALKKITLPASVSGSGINVENFGLKAISTNWVKDGTSAVTYAQVNVGGVYEKLLNKVTFHPTTDAADDILILVSEVNPSVDLPSVIENASGDAFVAWVDSKGVEYSKDVVDKTTPSNLYARYEHTMQNAIWGQDLYVLVYKNADNDYVGVYQKGNTPDAEYGTLVAVLKGKPASSCPAIYIGRVWSDNRRNYGYYTYTNELGATSLSYDLNKIIIKDNVTGLPAGKDFSLWMAQGSSDKICRAEHLERLDLSTVTGRLEIFLPYVSQGSSKTSAQGLGGIAQWDVSNVTSFSGIFASTAFDRCDVPDLSSWNTSSVTNMSKAFQEANGDISFAYNWDTSNVTDMSYVFSKAVNLGTFPSEWVTDNVTTLSYAFQKYDGSYPLDVANWNTENVTAMDYIFYQATTGNIAGIKEWDTSKVTTLAYAFADNSNFGDGAMTFIADWDVSNVNDFNSVFYNNTGLKHAALNWNMQSATNMNSMFNNCTGLISFESSRNWVATQDANTMWNTFYNCTSLQDISGVVDWDTSNVTTMTAMFSKTALRNVNALADWDVSKVTTMESMFSDCPYLNDINGLSEWRTSSLTNIANLFNNVKFLTSVEALRGWDVSNVTTMYYTFGSCAIVSVEPLGDWTVTNKLTNLQGVFYNNKKLESLEGLQNWDVSNVTTLYFAFRYDTRLKDASALSSWAPAALSSYQSMLEGCTNLKELDLGSWNVLNTAGDYNRSRYVIAHCDNLIKITFPENFAIHNSDKNDFDRYTYDSSHALAGDWIFEPTGETVSNLQTSVVSNWSSEKAGTYYKIYNLVLYPMGGSVEPAVIERTVLDEITELPVPTRDGYEFLGWFDSEGNEVTSIPAGSMITRLYAKWETSGYYTLILDPNLDGVDPVEVRLALDEHYKLRYTVFNNIPEGYQFLYWTERSLNTGSLYDNNTEIVGLGKVDDTVTLYAQWADKVQTPIPVKMHLINILTGEEVSSATYVASLNTTSNANDVYSVLQKADQYDQIQYCAYASDLDAAHFDYNEDDIIHLDYPYYISSYDDRWGTNYLGSVELPQDLISIERSQYINLSNHTWSLSDYGRDIYAYYLPAARVKVYFNAQQVEWLPVDELIMTVDGKEYRSGEYEVTINPWSDGGMNKTSYYTDAVTGNRVDTVYVPSWYADMRWGSGMGDISETVYRQLSTIGYYFNYPVNLYQPAGFVSYPGLDVTQPVFDGTASGYHSLYGKTLHMRHYTEVEAVSMALSNMDIVYDANGGKTFDNKDYYMFFTQLGYQGGDISRLHTYPINCKCTREGYVFDGWWSDPVGGEQILRPNETTNSSLAIHSLYNCPVVDYTDTWETALCGVNESGKLSPWGSTNDFHNTNYHFVTMYAHWIPEDEYVSPYPEFPNYNPNDYDSEYAFLTLHNTHDAREVWQYKLNYLPIAVAGDGTNTGTWFYIPTYQKDMNKYSDFIFDGWYTEPNGQGRRVSPSEPWNITDMGYYDLYANWETPDNVIYFEACSLDGSPDNATIAFTDMTHPAYYKVNGTNAFAYGGSKITSAMVPTVVAPEQYEFLGWFDADGNKLVIGDDTVNGKTYYGHWKKAEQSPVLDYSINLRFVDAGDIYQLPSSTYYGNVQFDFQVMMADDVVLPAKAVTIYIPNSSFRNYNQIGYSVNVEQGRYFISDYTSGYDADGNWRTRYYIQNGVDLTGSAGFEQTLTNIYLSDLFVNDEGVGYSTSAKTSSIYHLKTPVTIVIDADLDGVPEVVDNRYLYFRNVPYAGDTEPKSVFDNVAVYGDLWTSWSSKWGTQPADFDDYYYVGWSVSAMKPNSDGTKSSSSYSNHEMMYYTLALEPEHNGELVYPHDTYNYKGKEYNSRGNTVSMGDYYDTQIVIRYPKSEFNYNAQYAKLTQDFEVVASPIYPYADGTKSDFELLRTGVVVMNWAEGNTITFGDEVWANMGRYSNGYVSQYNANNTIQQQRQYSVFGYDTAGFNWFELYALNNTRSGRTSTEVTVQPGDFSYVSGFADDCYMYQPTTGRFNLTEDDYCITGYDWCIYNGNAQGTTSLSEVTRTSPVDVYVKYRGSDEWVLYYSGLGSAYVTENMKSYNDGHVDVQFQRHQGTNFATKSNIDGKADSEIVGVSVRADFDSSNYQVIVLLPKIKLLPDVHLKQLVRTDFDQEMASCICNHNFEMNGREDGVTYVSGQWGGNLIWDEDCGLTTWYLTSDVSPLTMANNIRILNNNVGSSYKLHAIQDGDVRASFEVVDQSNRASTYYMPIDSGDLYILLPENTSIKQTVRNVIATSGNSNNADATNTQLIRTTDNSYYGQYFTRNAASVGTGNYSIETIPNWENSGRTMVIYHYDNLTANLPIDTSINCINLVLDIHRDNAEENGYVGDIASLFVNTTGTRFVGQTRTYKYYAQNSDDNLVVQYFANTNAELAPTKQNGMAYATQNFTFYAVDPVTPVNEPVAHQNGFNEFIANSSNTFSNSAEIFPGETYTYKVFWSQSNGHTADSIVMYTKLDGVGTIQSTKIPTLKGNVLNEDTGEYEEVTVTPKVWYCKDPVFAAMSSEEFKNMDLSTLEFTAANQWYDSFEKGEVLSGVVFDYSKDDQGRTVFYEDDTYININLYMKNVTTEPTTFTSTSRLTVNGFALGNDVIGGNMLGQVVIPNLTVAVATEPESGTEAHPRDVRYEQDLIYHWYVHNWEDRSINNVVVTFDIPDGLACDLSKIKSNGIPITECPNITNVTLENGKVTLTLKTLESDLNGTGTFQIDEFTYVDVQVNGILFVNQGNIEGYNDVTPPAEQLAEYASDFTYHESFNLPEPTGFNNNGVAPIAVVFVIAVFGLGVTLIRRKKSDEAKGEK